MDGRRERGRRQGEVEGRGGRERWREEAGIWGYKEREGAGIGQWPVRGGIMAGRRKGDCQGELRSIERGQG